MKMEQFTPPANRRLFQICGSVKGYNQITISGQKPHKNHTAQLDGLFR